MNKHKTSKVFEETLEKSKKIKSKYKENVILDGIIFPTLLGFLIIFFTFITIYVLFLIYQIALLMPEIIIKAVLLLGLFYYVGITVIGVTYKKEVD